MIVYTSIFNIYTLERNKSSLLIVEDIYYTSGMVSSVTWEIISAKKVMDAPFGFIVLKSF